MSITKLTAIVIGLMLGTGAFAQNLVDTGTTTQNLDLVGSGTSAKPGSKVEPRQRKPSRSIEREPVAEESKPEPHVGLETDIGLARKSGDGEPKSTPETTLKITYLDLIFDYSMDKFTVHLRPNLLNINKTPIDDKTNTIKTSGPRSGQADGPNIFDDAWVQYALLDALALKTGIFQVFDHGFAEYTGYSNIKDIGSPTTTVLELSGKAGVFQYGAQTWEDQDTGAGTNMAFKLAYDKDGLNLGVIALMEAAFDRKANNGTTTTLTKENNKSGGEVWMSYATKVYDVHTALFQQIISKADKGNHSVLIGGSYLALDPVILHLDLQAYVVPSKVGEPTKGTQGTADFVADYKVNANLTSFFECQYVGKNSDDAEKGEAVNTLALGLRTRL